MTDGPTRLSPMPRITRGTPGPVELLVQHRDPHRVQALAAELGRPLRADQPGVRQRAAPTLRRRDAAALRPAARRGSRRWSRRWSSRSARPGPAVRAPAIQSRSSSAELLDLRAKVKFHAEPPWRAGRRGGPADPDADPVLQLARRGRQPRSRTSGQRRFPARADHANSPASRIACRILDQVLSDQNAAKRPLSGAGQGPPAISRRAYSMTASMIRLAWRRFGPRPPRGRPRRSAR